MYLIFLYSYIMPTYNRHHLLALACFRYAHSFKLIKIPPSQTHVYGEGGGGGWGGGVKWNSGILQIVTTMKVSCQMRSVNMTTWIIRKHVFFFFPSVVNTAHADWHSATDSDEQTNKGGEKEPSLPASPADTMCTWVESGSSTPFSFSLADE